MKQTISELIDQRLSAEEADVAFGRLARNPDGCRAWRNYHLIGDVIRGESLAGTCLLERVQSRIDLEPTVLAPAHAREQEDSTGAQVSSDAVKSAGLFAVAASLALVAVLTLSPEQGVAPGSQNVVQSATVPAAAPAADAESDAAAFESEFGQMLVEHGEFTANSGLNGLIAYAKLVSNERLGQ